MTAPPLVEIGECPVEVVYKDISPANTIIQPHAGDEGQFFDQSVNWYEPPHLAGELLLFVGISLKTDLAVPAGYTEVFNDVWDDAPITPPVHGTYSTTIGPAWQQSAQQLIGYRITTADGGSDSVPAGTYSGFAYNDNGLLYYSESMASRVYRFALETMGGDYPQAFDWPTNPVKIGPIDWEEYKTELGPDGDSNGDMINDGVGAVGSFYPVTDTPGPNEVAVTDVTADHPGNHIWMTIVSLHGPVAAEAISGGSSLQLFKSPTGPWYRTTGTPGLDTFGGMNASVGSGGGGSSGNNDLRAIAYLSGTSYGNPFRPFGWPDTVTGYFPAPLISGENGFSDTHYLPGTNVVGHVGTSWADGFIGVAGANTGDHYVWQNIGGVALQQLVIQGPETTRPPNDDIANATTPPQCPVMMVECTFGQSSEPGETVGGLGQPGFPNNSVWFTYTPASTETDVLISTDVSSSDPSLGDFPPYSTEYDTLLLVYSGTPGSLSLLASDDGGGGHRAAVTVTLTGGVTYYIQVAGYGGDEGRLLLTVDCEGILAYWGINASTPT